MEKIKVGVAGVGFIGAVHIEQLRRLPMVEVVAVADPFDATEKARRLGVQKAYDSTFEMLEKEPLDAIHLCTPNNLHLDEALLAFTKGVHVICEKPLTTSLENAKRMSDAAKKAGLIHAVNFNYRFYPLAYEMRQRRLSGELGEVYSVHGSYLQDWLFLKTDYSWRLESDISGRSRAFADIGSHWADLVSFVTGLKPVEVMADFATFHKTRSKPLKPLDTYSNMMLTPADYEEIPIDTEDYAAVLFRLENGGRASCVISQMFAGKKNEMRVLIAGSKSSMIWDSADSNELWVGRRDAPNEVYEKDPSLLAVPTRRLSSYPGGHVEGFADSMKQHFALIYEAIASGTTGEHEYADFDDGLMEVSLCDKIIESAKTRSWIAL